MYAIRSYYADLGGGLSAALGQLAHLGRDHGEALAVFPGPRRLDGRVERQEVGLPGRITSYNVCYTKLLRAVLQLDQVIQQNASASEETAVITSYSIHYTKLYDEQLGIDQGVPLLPARPLFV